MNFSVLMQVLISIHLTDFLEKFLKKQNLRDNFLDLPSLNPKRLGVVVENTL